MLSQREERERELVRGEDVSGRDLTNEINGEMEHTGLWEATAVALAISPGMMLLGMPFAAAASTISCI